MVVPISHRLALALAPLVAGACSFSSGNDVAARDASVEIDAAPDDDASGPRSSHILLSEIKTTVTGEEFVEIVNATGGVVDLTGYYLADSAEYARLPGQFGAGPAPDVNEADFVVGFPTGATLASGEAAVIALDGSAFAAAFGFEPRFAIAGTADARLFPAYEDAVGPFVSLTDDGEAVALFFWDGQSDLVTDVDLVQAGADATPTNRFVDKGGLAVDGPDDGDGPSSYAAEAFTLGATVATTAASESYERAALEIDHELESGGNGLGGHDESSEDLAATWSITATPNPGVAPNLR